MGECNKNEKVTYDDLYDKLSYFKDEYQIDANFDKIKCFGNESRKIINTKEEIESILKECIENVVVEIEDVIEKRFREYNFPSTYNRHINEWNEVLCRIEVNGKLVEVKLNNDYKCDDANNITSVYITLYSGGKGVFTECIKRINQEYEFIGSSYSYIPITESELYFKEIDKNKFIECILYEINGMI